MFVHHLISIQIASQSTTVSSRVYWSDVGVENSRKSLLLNARKAVRTDPSTTIRSDEQHYSSSRSALAAVSVNPIAQLKPPDALHSGYR